MINNSRLSRRLENRTKKKLFINIIGIIIVIFLLMKFLIPIIIWVSTFLSGTKNIVEISENKNNFIQPPTLNTQQIATSSAILEISGSSGSKQIIILFINEIEIEKTKTNDNGSFVFSNIYLKKGKNTILTKAIIDKKITDFSNKIIIEYKKEPPSLAIDSPREGESFSKDNKIKIKGKTDSDVKITINGIWAIVNDNGFFEYEINLQNGENKIIVIAEDIATNKTKREIKLNYSP
ncbi:MAG: hypothetical protein NTZ20_01760 [Candidatus Levybacteria bacterium]|nr:hypothetical protein [Candidatus Levybacteria bacterium]